MTNPFDKISKKNKEKLLKLLKTHNIYYKKNEKLLKDTDDISIVITGYLHVIRNNYNGTQNIVEEYDENDIIGSNSSYINNPEYEIICKEDTTLLIFNYNELINIETNDKTYNQFIKNLFIIMNEKMLTKNERIDILTKKTIRNKLLEYFSIMSKKNGSRYIYLPFTFSDLANYIAVDRSAMSREISYLKEEGIIEVKGKRITLLYR